MARAAFESQPPLRAHARPCAPGVRLRTTEAHGERVGLLLQERVALLGADQLDLHHLEVLPGGEHIEPNAARRHLDPVAAKGVGCFPSWFLQAPKSLGDRQISEG